MRRIVFLAVAAAALLAGCTLDVKTGDAVVEGKCTDTYNGRTSYKIFGEVGGEFVMWYATKEEYDTICKGDTLEFFQKPVYHRTRQTVNNKK